MNMADVGKASSMAAKVLGKTTRVTFNSAKEQWDCNKIGKD